MKTSKLIALSLAASVAGVAVAETTGARALFVSGEALFPAIAFLGIAAIAVADLLRHRKTASVPAQIIRPAAHPRTTPVYFTRHSRVTCGDKAA
jgi:hypothetical protein